MFCPAPAGFFYVMPTDFFAYFLNGAAISGDDVIRSQTDFFRKREDIAE